MTNRKRTFVLFVALGAAGIFSAALTAEAPGSPPRVFQRGGVEAPRTVWDGVYTEEQAKLGAVLFDKECAQCHGPSGEGGGMAPALAGPGFSANYDGLTMSDLFDRNRTTMPPGKEGQIAGRDIASITAFMLQVNGFPVGQVELPSQSMTLKSIAYLALKP